MPSKSKTAGTVKETKPKEEPKAKAKPALKEKITGGDAPTDTVLPQKVTFAKLLASVKKNSNKKEKTIALDDLYRVFDELSVSEVFKNQKNKKRANTGANKHITDYNHFTSWIIKEMKENISQQEKMSKAAKIWSSEYKGNPAKIAEFKKKAGIATTA